MHLLIHFDNIDGSAFQCIRIINVPSIRSYNEEYKIVYGIDSITNNFYNCGDMSIRLLHDLEYKKFKNVKIEKTIDSIYKVIGHTELFQDEFIKYVNMKISSYIEECDDNYFDISINTIWTSKYCECSYTRPYIVDPESIKDYENLVIDYKYKLLLIEQSDDKYILSNMHLNSLVFKYINNNFFILKKEHKYTISDIEVIKINRGILIANIDLTINDVEKIFDVLNITVDMLIAISLSKNYINSIDVGNAWRTEEGYGGDTYSINPITGIDEALNSLNSCWDPIIPKSSTTQFTKNELTFTYADGICNITKNDNISDITKNKIVTDTPIQMTSTQLNRAINGPPVSDLGAYDNTEYFTIDGNENYDILTPKKFALFTIEEILESKITSATPLIKPVIKPKPVKTNIYKNLLNQKLKTYDIDEFKYLNEFEKILTLNSQINVEIFELINNNKSISNYIISELQNLLNVFKQEDYEYVSDENESHNQNESHSVNLRPRFEIGLPQTGISMLEQKKLTLDYVKKYKNDTIETLASTVIDNVNKYLLQTIKDINKNQIGKDLVDFGIKKTRKSKGFVYGIEDTSNDLDTSKFGMNCRFNKNKTLEIRSAPPNPVFKDCSPFNMSPHIF